MTTCRGRRTRPTGRPWPTATRAAMLQHELRCCNTCCGDDLGRHAVDAPVLRRVHLRLPLRRHPRPLIPTPRTPPTHLRTNPCCPLAPPHPSHPSTHHRRPRLLSPPPRAARTWRRRGREECTRAGGRFGCRVGEAGRAQGVGGGGGGGGSWHLCDGGLEEESEPLILSPSQVGHEVPGHLLHR